MGFFGIKKKEDVLDLSKNYHRVNRVQRTSEELDLTKQEPVKESNSIFPFFGSNQSSSVSSNSEDNDLESPEEKRKKLAKRLVDMTNHIEELDNKIYHLQQRIEVLEKKEGLTGFESHNSNSDTSGLACF